MTWARGAAILVSVGIGAALCLAVVSRAPSHVRSAGPGPEARDPALGARFTEQQVARHGAYRRAAYSALGLGLLIQVVTLIVLARGPVASVAGTLERSGVHWLWRHALIALLVLGVLMVVTMPLGYIGFEIGHAWGLSTQNVTGWVLDRLRAFAIGGVVAVLAALAFFGAVRLQPRSWWVWAWLAFSALTILLAYVWPVVVAPLFNRFEPLERGSLHQRVRALASDAGIPVEEVFVVDASKRSTTENAYVAGLGNSKRLVLFDTLIKDAAEDEAAFVVAHELGHQVENHVAKNVVLRVLGLLLGFAVLAWLATRPALWSWAHASGIGDVRALPLLLLFAIAANVVALPVENAISRHFESEADRIAFELTDDPETAVRVFRRLAFSNISDLRPPSIAVWTLFTHPPVTARIASAEASAGP